MDPEGGTLSMMDCAVVCALIFPPLDSPLVRSLEFLSKNDIIWNNKKTHSLGASQYTWCYASDQYTGCKLRPYKWQKQDKTSDL